MKENSIEEDIKILKELRIANENCIENAKIKDNPFVAIWEKQNGAIEHILSDYKRILKENELLRKDIEGWKKYCEEIEEEQTEMSNKNCELEFEIEKLQKENEELRESNKKLYEIGQEMCKQDKYTRENYISVQKVKDKIEELNQYYKKEIYPSLSQWSDITITEHYDEMIELLQELLGDK